MPDDTNSAAPPLGAGPVFQFLRDNFAVISGLAVVAGIGLSTIFLSAYLSFFDWHLLWFVQYIDILSFGLIAVRIVGGSLIFLQAATQTIIAVFRIGGASKKRYLIGFAIFLLAIVGFNVWGSIHRGEGYFHILFGALALVLGVLFFLLMFVLVKAGKWPDAAQVMFAIVVIITGTVCFGQWLAYSVSETSEFDQDVQFKNGTLTDAKLVIVMTRHTIFQKDSVLYPIPTADIEQFKTAGKH
jgi:hypothetical protein